MHHLPATCWWAIGGRTRSRVSFAAILSDLGRGFGLLLLDHASFVWRATWLHSVRETQQGLCNECDSMVSSHVLRFPAWCSCLASPIRHGCNVAHAAAGGSCAHHSAVAATWARQQSHRTVALGALTLALSAAYAQCNVV